MITEYKLITTDSSDAKLITGSRNEIHFDLHALRKSLRDGNLTKNYFNKKTVVASGIKRSETTNFLTQDPHEFCDRLRLIIQEKQAGNDTTRFDNETVAFLDKFLEYNYFNPVQHKKNYSKM